MKTKDGDQSKEDFDGYEFVETKKDPKTGDVTHYYKDKEVAPITTLTIFKDENGNVIKTEKVRKIRKTCLVTLISELKQIKTVIQSISTIRL